MPAFDTSALVPLFFEANEHHEAAKQAFAEADQVILHPNVIAEFTTVMRRELKDLGEDGNIGARVALMSLIDEPRVVVRADMKYDDAIELYLADTSISFTDAIVSESQWFMDKQAPVSFDDGIHRATGISEEERQERVAKLR